MAIDSNFPGEDRGATGAGERASSAGLKLVSGRNVPADESAGPGATFADDPAAAGEPPPKGVDASARRPTNASREVRSSGRRLPAWLFAALVVLFLAAYGYQSYHASRLEEEVARLEASLATAEGRLESHRAHLLEIRSGIHDLSGRLEALQALIDRDPTAAAPGDGPAARPGDAPTP